MGIEHLCRDTGLDHREIRRLLTYSGVPLRTQRTLPAEQTPWVVEQYRAGATLRELAERTGCSLSTIRRSLLHAGVVLRSRGMRSPR